MSLLTLDNSVVHLSDCRYLMRNYYVNNVPCFFRLTKGGKVVYDYHNPKGGTDPYSVISHIDINNISYTFLGNYFYDEVNNIVTTEGFYIEEVYPYQSSNGIHRGSTSGTHEHPSIEYNLSDVDTNFIVIFNKTGDDQVDIEEGILNTNFVSRVSNNMASGIGNLHVYTIFRQDNFEDKYDGTSTITMPTTYPTYNPDGTGDITRIYSYQGASDKYTPGIIIDTKDMDDYYLPIKIFNCESNSI